MSSFGLPGGIITMVAFGSLTGNLFALLGVMAVSFIAAVIGDILAYELIRKFSNKLEDKLRSFSFFKDNEHKTRKLLSLYEFPIIFFTRFAITSLCAVVSYICGLEKINRKKFILAVISGEFLFAVIYPLIGFTAGELFNNILSAINYSGVTILLIAILVYLIKKFFRKNNA